MSNFVFLGGTCNGDDWREKLIPLLNVNYFNPVVEDWNEEKQKIEEQKKKEAYWHLYLLTPKAKGCFSYIEAVSRLMTNPSTTIIGWLDTSDGTGWDNDQIRSIGASAKLLERLGKDNVFIFKDIESVAAIVNHICE